MSIFTAERTDMAGYVNVYARLSRDGKAVFVLGDKVWPSMKFAMDRGISAPETGEDGPQVRRCSFVRPIELSTERVLFIDRETGEVGPL